MIQLNYRDAKPIYEQIKDGLRKLVITNSLIANEKLPSVREMASKLAINPNTIQKAYRELEAEGYVYTVAGKGTFVAERKEVLGVRNEELMKEFDAEVVGTGVFISTIHPENKLVSNYISLLELDTANNEVIVYPNLKTFNSEYHPQD